MILRVAFGRRNEWEELIREVGVFIVCSCGGLGSLFLVVCLLCVWVLGVCLCGCDMGFEGVVCDLVGVWVCCVCLLFGCCFFVGVCVVVFEGLLWGCVCWCGWLFCVFVFVLGLCWVVCVSGVFLCGLFCGLCWFLFVFVGVSRISAFNLLRCVVLWF